MASPTRAELLRVALGYKRVHGEERLREVIDAVGKVANPEHPIGRLIGQVEPERYPDLATAMGPVAEKKEGGGKFLGVVVNAEGIERPMMSDECGEKHRYLGGWREPDALRDHFKRLPKHLKDELRKRFGFDKAKEIALLSRDDLDRLYFALDDMLIAR